MNAPTGQPSLHDAIVAFLRERPAGVPAVEIAERFLKLKNPDRRISAAAIAGVLGADRRCFSDANGNWHAGAAAPPSTKTLGELPWMAVFCLTDPGARRVLYCALWEITPSFACLGSGWCADPHALQIDEYDTLRSAADAAFSDESAGVLLAAAAAAGEKHLPVFLSAAARGCFIAACAARGDTLTDDTVIAGGLLAAAGLPVPRPVTPATLEKTVFGAEQPGESARKQGERFAAALHELLRLCARNGIESRAQLDRFAGEDKSPLFAGKEFTYETLLALPARPGVYGFKDRAGGHLYVGKANNLKRRLLSHFCETHEPPHKIERLRTQSHALVTHVCGSELECLIYEYRLIKKYSPPLNKKTETAERNGVDRPLGDCIVLLPHAEENKTMSVWLRENQRILLKSFPTSFEADPTLPGELKTFFFTPRLPAVPCDLPEVEIATRWIRRHADALVIVPVDRRSCAEETLDAIRIARRLPDPAA
jgi:hypothetical protein